ncbi:MAG TPA: hypothetical protein ENI51_08530, partial [Candidatus Atribacteria bacterium]|nr:hypothetical protein [Candidatus Atribacteria bacterium]
MKKYYSQSIFPQENRDSNMLRKEYDTLSRYGVISKDIPDFITNNLNPAFELREYQKEAIVRFIYYISEDNQRI